MENDRLSLDSATLRYLNANPDSPAVQQLVEDYKKSSVAQFGVSDSISCKQMWGVLTEAILTHAEGFSEELFRDFAVADADDARYEENKDRLCRQIAGKLSHGHSESLYAVAENDGDTDGDGEEDIKCDLVVMTTMFMMKNALLNATGSVSYTHLTLPTICSV